MQFVTAMCVASVQIFQVLECLLIGNLLLPGVHHLLGEQLLLERNHLLFVNKLLVVIVAQTHALRQLLRSVRGPDRAVLLSLCFKRMLQTQPVLLLAQVLLRLSGGPLHGPHLLGVVRLVRNRRLYLLGPVHLLLPEIAEVRLSSPLLVPRVDD
jgi:hypothetical protein